MRPIVNRADRRNSPRELVLVVSTLLAISGLPTICLGDKAFDDAVERAVKKGGRWLLAAAPRPEYRQQGYPMGVEGLALYALLHAGVPPDHAFIKERFEIMDSLEPQQTYGVSLAILAHDAWNRARFPIGTPPKPVGGAGRARMQRMVDWLVANYAGGTGSWRYHLGHASKPDFSNTQFAVLALAIAMRNNIGVDVNLFRDVGNNLVKRQAFESTTEIPIKVTYEVTGDAKADARRPILPGRGKPGGWRYLSDDEFWGQKPTFSMTAAGCSSLLVASEALRRNGQNSPTEFKKATRDGLIWLTKHLGELHKYRGRSRGLYKDYFYGLYSLEKVGDLGKILKFGRYEWYRKEAQYLLRTQRGDGSWGSTKGMDRFVHTSLAILFLTRATNLEDKENRINRPTGSGPKPYISKARVIKSGGKNGDQSQLLDRVFSNVLGKWVDVHTFFVHLRTVRDTGELKIARDIVKNTIPDEKPQLIPHLATLFDGSKDSIERFGKSQLASLTGIKRDEPREYVAWFERWKKLRKIGERRQRSKLDEALAVLADKKESMQLRLTALWSVRRVRDRHAVAHLIALLDLTPKDLRKPIHTALCEISGISHEYDPKQWTGTVAVWVAWAKAEGVGKPRDKAGSSAATTKVARAEVDPTIEKSLDALEKARTAKEASSAMQTLVSAEIDQVVPAVLERMDSDDYSFFLVEVLERISGKKLGPARRPWERWWAKR